MDIRIDVSEARILKLAMDGIKPADIEKQLAAEIRQNVIDSLREKMRQQVEDLSYKRDADEAIKCAVVKNMQDQLKKILTPANIAKEFKRDDWSRLFENTVQPVVANFIEHALSEWLSLSIVVKGGKKEHHVELAGVDSYTWRKK